MDIQETEGNLSNRYVGGLQCGVLASMSNRNRPRPFGVAITSTVLALCLILSIAAYRQVLGYRDGHADERQQAAEQHRREADNRIEFCLGITVEDRAAERFECLSQAIESAQDAANAKYDLKAQQDMAAWALGVLLVSIAALIATIIGVFFVALTLRETRRIGQAEVRAYLSETRIQFEYLPNPDDARFPHSYRFHHHWTNTGNSPAFECELESYYCIVRVDDDRPVAEIVALPEMKMGSAVVAARGTMWTEAKAVKGTPVEDWLANRVGMVLYCRTAYRDVFDAPRFTESAHYLVKTQTSPDRIRVDFRTYPHHNRAT